MADAPHVDTSYKAEALERALATLWQGFGVDFLAMVGSGLMVMLGDLDPTSPVFWTALAALVLKSLFTALASYFVRLKIAPVTGQPKAPATPAAPALTPAG